MSKSDQVAQPIKLLFNVSTVVSSFLVSCELKLSELILVIFSILKIVLIWHRIQMFAEANIHSSLPLHFSRSEIFLFTSLFATNSEYQKWGFGPSSDMEFSFIFLFSPEIMRIHKMERMGL